MARNQKKSKEKKKKDRTKRDGRSYETQPSFINYLPNIPHNFGSKLMTSNKCTQDHYFIDSQLVTTTQIKVYIEEIEKLLKENNHKEIEKIIKLIQEKCDSNIQFISEIEGEDGCIEGEDKSSQTPGKALFYKELIMKPWYRLLSMDFKEGALDVIPIWLVKENIYKTTFCLGHGVARGHDKKDACMEIEEYKKAFSCKQSGFKQTFQEYFVEKNEWNTKEFTAEEKEMGALRVHNDFELEAMRKYLQ